MKNSLHVLALIFAAGIPDVIAASFAGVPLPAALGAQAARRAPSDSAARRRAWFG